MASDRQQHGEPVLTMLLGVESNEALAARAASDPAALTELYQRFLPRVYHYCRYRMRDVDQVDDVVSQIFLRVLEGLRIKTIESVEPWIFTIARNEVITSWRKQRPHLTLDFVQNAISREPTPDDIAISLADERDVRTLLDRLNQNERDVVELRLFGFSGPEIAIILNRSYSWVGTTQHRAYARLRTMVLADSEQRGN